MSFLTLQHVTKRFGSFTALDDVVLEVAEGELFFLLGASGSGKTTLLRTIAGLVTAHSGTVHLGSREITCDPPHSRNTPLLFQSSALWPHLTVAQNVGFGLIEQRLPESEIKKKVAQGLALVRLEQFGLRQVRELSGGQQKRVALARALVLQPACLLLDEPLANLDGPLRAELLQEIVSTVRDRRITTLYVTHDPWEAIAAATRLGIMVQGKIVQTGSPEEVYLSPANSSVARLLRTPKDFPAWISKRTVPS